MLDRKRYQSIYSIVFKWYKVHRIWWNINALVPWWKENSLISVKFYMLLENLRFGWSLLWVLAVYFSLNKWGFFIWLIFMCSKYWLITKWNLRKIQHAIWRIIEAIKQKGLKQKRYFLIKWKNNSIETNFLHISI